MSDLFIVISDTIERYKKALVALAVLGIGGFAAVYFYSDWKVQVEQNAQIAFSSIVEEVQKASQEGPADWQHIEQEAEHAITQHSRSHLVPYFFALQAQALIEQDKKDQAMTVMETMLSKLSTSSPLYYLFQIKLARMKFSNEATQQDGLLLLQKLADNNKNPYQDEALFYLGKFYEQQQDYEKARALWNQLIYAFSSESALGKSPWVDQAQQQLQKLPPQS